MFQTSNNKTENQLALAAYVCLLATTLFGFSWIVAVGVAWYLVKHSLAPHIKSHSTWILRTTAIFLLALVLLAALALGGMYFAVRGAHVGLIMVFGSGGLAVLAVGWFLYRCIKGMVKLSQNKPV